MQLSNNHNQKLAKRYKISLRKFILTLSVIVILAVATTTVDKTQALASNSFLAKVYEIIFQGQTPAEKHNAIYAENANPQSPIDVNTGLNPSFHTKEVAGVMSIDADAFNKLQQQVSTLQLQLSQPAQASQNVLVIDTAGVNLLRNSSFEAGGAGSIPSQWNAQLDSTSGNTFISAEGIHSGSYGLKFLGGGTGNFGISQPSTKTVPQRIYTLSVWIKNVNTPNATFRIGFWDEQNNKEGSFKNISISGTKDWYRVSTTVTTPGQITDLKNYFPMFEVQGLTRGAVYMDDVLLTEGSVLTDYNTAQASSGSNSSTLGDGAILGSSGGDLYPAQSGVGQLGTSSNRWSALNLTKATIDSNGSLNLSGGLTVQALGSGIMHVGSGGAVTSSAVNLASSDVTGQLPVGNITGTLTVGNGGTGQTSFTANGVLYGNGANAIQVLAPGTSGYVLQTNGSGSAPTWVAASGIASSFASLTGGTNTGAAMVVGTGASLTTSGSGTINANQLNGQTTSVGGALTTASSFTTSGANALTLTTTGATNVTLPTSGTLSTFGGTFANLASGTNTTAAMVVGSGATLGGTGTGTITATGADTVGNTTLSLGTANANNVTIGNSANNSQININSGTSAQTFTSTAATTNAYVFTANSETSGNGLSVSASALTTGAGASITAGGATALTSGNALLVTGPTGAAALSGAAGGVVNLTAAGAYTSANNAGLLNLNANGTLSGNVQTITANGLTTGTGLLVTSSGTLTTTGNLETLTANSATTPTGVLTVNASALNSGFAENINVNGATALTSGGALNVVGPTGAAAISNNAGLVQISAAGNFTTTAGSGGLLDVIDNSVTTGTLASIADSAIMTTTGNLLTLTANNATSTNGLLTVNANGLTTGTGVLLTSSGVITTGGQVLSVVASGATTGNAATITANGLTTGNILSLTSSSAVASHNSVGLNINLSGAGATSTNTAASFAASGATNNYGLLVTAGATGLGTSAPLWKLHVSDSQAATASAMIENLTANGGASAPNFHTGLNIRLGALANATNATINDRFINFMRGDGYVQGSVQGNGATGVTFSTTGGDMAEYFTQVPGVNFEEGDVISLGGSNGQSAAKSTKAYETNLLGVYSLHPAFTGGTPGTNKVLVGLIGQLPVKVSTENGSIQVGDPLTSSATYPGVAMKSTKQGTIIGKALESYSGSGIGKINTYVNANYDDAPALGIAPSTNTPVLAVSQAPTAAGATLDVAAATATGGVSTVQNDVEYKGTSLFDKLATFISNVVFNSDVSFFGRTTFNKDTAGKAIVKKGANAVYIAFQKPYDQLPEVNISVTLPKGSDQTAQTALEQAILTGDVKYIVTSETEKGFVIELNKTAPADITFSWTALAVKDATVQTSPDSVSVTPAPSVTTTPAPSVSVTSTPIQSGPIPSSAPTVSPVPSVIPSVTPAPSVTTTPAPSVSVTPTL